LERPFGRLIGGLAADGKISVFSASPLGGISPCGRMAFSFVLIGQSHEDRSDLSEGYLGNPGTKTALRGLLPAESPVDPLTPIFHTFATRVYGDLGNGFARGLGNRDVYWRHT
jgi:hypothetical protein